MIPKRALKLLNDLDSRGQFWFSNKQPLNANVHFLEKSKYYAYTIMFLKILVV